VFLFNERTRTEKKKYELGTRFAHSERKCHDCRVRKKASKKHFIYVTSKMKEKKFVERNSLHADGGKKKSKKS